MLHGARATVRFDEPDDTQSDDRTFDVALELALESLNRVLRLAFYASGHQVIPALESRDLVNLVVVARRQNARHCDGELYTRPPASEELVLPPRPARHGEDTLAVAACASMGSMAAIAAPGLPRRAAGRHDPLMTSHRFGVSLSLSLGLVIVTGCGASHAADDAGPALDARSSEPDAAPSSDAPPVPDAPQDDASRPRVDLIVELRGFDAFEGDRATVHATDTSIGERHGPASATLVEGDADLVLPGAFARDLFSELGQLWIDADRDGACVDGTDPAYGFFINNDFEEGPERVTVTAGDPMLTTSTCAEAE